MTLNKKNQVHGGTQKYETSRKPKEYLKTVVNDEWNKMEEICSRMKQAR